MNIILKEIKLTYDINKAMLGKILFINWLSSGLLTLGVLMEV